MKCACAPSGDEIILCDAHAREFQRRLVIHVRQTDTARTEGFHEAIEEAKRRLIGNKLTETWSPIDRWIDRSLTSCWKAKWRGVGLKHE
jgi:hypothetical protein